MSTLLVIYMSFSGVAFANEYRVPTNTCHAQGQQIRRNVKAGRVWVFCNA
jgi:hypothetical protein